MKDTKQQILEKAFMIFLEKGYDKVSISDIQKEIGMGRASMYHYFKSKEDLFNNVMQHCYMAAGKAKHLRDIKNKGLKSLLDTNIKQHRDALAYQDAMNGKRIGFFNYYLIAYQAIKSCPDFGKEALQLQQLELEQWKSVIAYSIETGEIKPDLDIDETAKLFINAENGIAIRVSFCTPLEEVISAVERMYQHLYKLVKV